MNFNKSHNQLKEKLITTLKNIVEDKSLQVEFNEDVKNNFFAWNQNLVLMKKKVALPQVLDPFIRRGDKMELKGDKVEFLSNKEDLQDEREELRNYNYFKAVNNCRSAADLAACYLLFHNQQLPQQTNLNQEEQKFFDDFEKIRVIARIKNSYLGIVKNILSKIEEDIYSDSENLSLIFLEEIFADKILPKTKIAIEESKSRLNNKILKQFGKLAKKIPNQNEFRNEVAKLLEMLRNEQERRNENQEKNDENNLYPQNQKDDLVDFAQENVAMENKLENLSDNQETTESDITEQEKEITDFKEDENGGSIKVKSEKTEFSEEKIEFKNAYKIFTSKFDEIVFPQKLVSKNELELLRDQLDLKMMKLNEISKKMTLKLKRKLMAKKNSYIEKDNNSGVLDRKKLTRFVLDPFMEDIWINNQERQYQDTALTILLDNSGSMRGQPIVMSALACEIIAGILEKFSIKTEIIGFTTADWKGGKARKMWESSGRIKNPGRLNEVRHIIYKSSNQRFKKSKLNLGLMLKEGILKENIDGEALLFAKARLMQRDEKRKILMVISDGTPIDDSTNSANDEDILSNHLHHVINKIEKQSKIEIVGIGIGHSADDFYKNSISIKSLEELGDVMIEKLVGLL